jgi:hypothetical protein
MLKGAQLGVEEKKEKRKHCIERYTYANRRLEPHLQKPQQAATRVSTNVRCKQKKAPFFG